ncbi:class I SAM-dependent methyltransferase [Nesterenkonia sp. MY13]|uniref:Class I SAM-dependent methyltransferase n=1 Tax=Nesterenkonia sedimenti TaxID=1463632 RepID=A0A7X8YF38_9MICC|nr:class I SAM-dependent methyltransferase [Nesterenkonia sedimenti]NLS10912.1 class I SAM-dependent methyltransferase [Nesterenkonia sedimenti]
MSSTAEADWAEYYRKVQGRSARELVLEAAALAEKPGSALDLGCGDGAETLYLLERGWSVTAVDLEPAAIDLTRQRAGESAELNAYVADLAKYSPEPADLILASVSLPFIPEEAFNRLWPQLVAALNPHGILAVHLFGDRDSWARGEAAVAGMTFHSRAEVEQLLTGLDVLDLQEHEFDGPSGRGPKHWHRYDIIARRPAAN